MATHADRYLALTKHYTTESKHAQIHTPNVFDIHKSLQEYLTDVLKYSLRQWVSKFISGVTVKVVGSVDRNLFSADEAKLKGKTPDQGFHVKVPGFRVRRYPNIIVEIGYSESRPDLIDDARRWLTETHGEPVLCVLIFYFRKPSRHEDFEDLSKWEAFLEVYERDPNNDASYRLFDEPIDFVPIISPAPTFQLALRHLLPSDQIPDGTDAATVENFRIVYEHSDLEDAIYLMGELKCRREEANEEREESAGKPEAKKLKWRGGDQ